MGRWRSIVCGWTGWWRRPNRSGRPEFGIVAYLVVVGGRKTLGVILTNMTKNITLDKAGRVLIPKSLRQELRVDPGDSLRPLRPEALLKRERAFGFIKVSRP